MLSALFHIEYEKISALTVLENFREHYISAWI